MPLTRTAAIVAIACASLAIGACHSPSTPNGAAVNPVNPVSAAGPASPVNPGNGSWSYRLTLSWPSICQGPLPYTFDGTLTVAEGELQFLLPSADPRNRNAGDLSVSITRAAGQLSGTIRTSTSAEADGDWIFITKQYPTTTLEPASVLGKAADMGGLLNGTFDGYVHTSNANADRAMSCTSSGFTWTLMPY
jgi:hypothetical protein